MKQIFAGLALIGVAATSCNTAADKQKEAALRAQQNTIDSMKLEMVKKQVADSMNEVAKLNYMLPATMAPAVQEQNAPVRSTTRRSTTRRSSASSTRSSNSGGYASSSNTNTGTQPVVYQPAPVYEPAPAPAPEKKGWSAKAKGAVIGGATGAAAGAIIHKRQRAVGAVVGGVLGAGAGTGIGAIIDKKNGR
ncbi:MAG: hypothetical protein EOP56_14440 [Sphingobacteriales bacterium]|nr:MAG: hypothetical protein EOP56_14440 [Sphingobacteriales bacterium]